MRILCRAYDLDDTGGSGATFRAIVRYLRQRGEDVWATDEPHDVHEVRGWRPDVILGQQWATDEASAWATALRVPFVMVVHGRNQYERFMPQCDLVVFNTHLQHDFARAAIGRTPAMVLHAPTPRRSAESGLDALRARLQSMAVEGRRRPTLTLCMTVANEGQTLEQAIRSVEPVVDEVVIGVDAKSDDVTGAIAKRCATRTFVFAESSPPDFPRMRNRAMDLVETDWAIVLDGHEWIEHADRIPDALETTAWSIEIETLYEPDENRIPGLAFPFPRIHRRHVRFSGAAAHEEVTTPHERRESHLEIKVWHERKPGAAARSRSLEKAGAELMRLREAWQRSGDRRALFYLANGLRESGRFDEAIAAYEEYLQSPNFRDEGWQAGLYLARCHAEKADWAAARRRFEDALIACPERAEAVFGLGHVCLAAGDARQAAAWFRMATGIPQPGGCRMFVEVPVYRWGAWHGLALALHRQGDYGGAAAAEMRAIEGGAGPWAADNVAWWRARATQPSDGALTW
jgi:glycosyltransferase involved in cell wall biosynthesis